MRIATTALALLWAAQAASSLEVYEFYGHKSELIEGSGLHERQARPSSYIPGYNFTMPVDHFDAGNKATYSNRYWVNDTYYKPGGPVILYDYGESGVTQSSLVVRLGEDGGLKSAVMQAARALGGLAILWEHRYFGSSLPVPLSSSSGLPTAGASGYKYHTIEQALEDLAYFANNFNKTASLDRGTVVRSTAGLDPYHTPWVIIGGSYPGMRAAWSRIRHPDVWYAAWASSAPVQTIPDGSLYYRPIERSLPRNCSADVKAAIKYVDDSFASGDAARIAAVKAAVYVSAAGGSLTSAASGSASWSAYTTAGWLADAVRSTFQSRGPIITTQPMCDFIEAFDVGAYTRNATAQSSARDLAGATISNPGRAKFTDKGIAASNGDNGELAFRAFIFGIYRADRASGASKKRSETDVTMARRSDSMVVNHLDNTAGNGASLTNGLDTPADADVNNHGWAWLSFTEAGFFQGSNTSDTLPIVSKWYNYTAVRDGYKSQFNFPSSAYPASLNNSLWLSLGGWNMQPSNVMFTNGEFDPWRSFSVASEESDHGAPKRAHSTAAIPSCNAPPNGTDVFGMVFPGAVHAEDLTNQRYQRGSISKVSPLDQALPVFVAAYQAWAPCFNQSRDDVRNGKGVDGKGAGVGQGSTSSVAGGPSSTSPPTSSATGGGGGGGGGSTTSTSRAGGVPVQTGAVGAAALFAGAGILANL